MRGISWQAEDVFASQEGFCCMELVNTLFTRLTVFWCVPEVSRLSKVLVADECCVIARNIHMDTSVKNWRGGGRGRGTLSRPCRIKRIAFNSQGRPETLGRPRQANTFVSLKTDIILPTSSYDRASKSFWGRVPNLRINFGAILSCVKTWVH